MGMEQACRRRAAALRSAERSTAPPHALPPPHAPPLLCVSTRLGEDHVLEHPQLVLTHRAVLMRYTHTHTHREGRGGRGGR